MKEFFKKHIRNLYWKYAHEGDAWQARLVVYHFGNMIANVPSALPSKDVSGRFIIAQIEDHMNKAVLSPIADIKLNGFIE